MHGNKAKIIAGLTIFIICFFAFAPEDRVHSIKLIVLSILRDPDSRCTKFHKNDFIDPGSVRSTGQRGLWAAPGTYFLGLSARTQGGGRAITEVVCLDDPSLYRSPRGDVLIEDGLQALDRKLSVDRETQRIREEIADIRARRAQRNLDRGLDDNPRSALDRLD